MPFHPIRGIPACIDVCVRCAPLVLLLWCMAPLAHAGSVYRCTDARGHVTFRDTPCPSHERQSEVSLAGQPLIDPTAPPPVAAPAATRARAATRRVATARSRRAAATSWECHAANGEVFYRHGKCPSTVAGDGVVRERYAEHRNGTRTRTDRGAWGRVPVHGAKITRAEACQRMRSASAAGRDGHLRDERASTYDHLMGRDPCSAE